MSVLKDLTHNLLTLEAMANGRADGIAKVNSLLNPIITHLIKLAIIDDISRDIYVEGWQHEVLNWISDINFTCNNLKGGKRLKLRDYLRCLQDDLGSEARVRSHITRIKLKWGRTPPATRAYSLKGLRDVLWALLETQFKALSNDSWDVSTLTECADYKSLLKGTSIV